MPVILPPRPSRRDPWILNPVESSQFTQGRNDGVDDHLSMLTLVFRYIQVIQPFYLPFRLDQQIIEMTLHFSFVVETANGAGYRNQLDEAK